MGCNTSEPVAAGLPLPAPALRRFGSTEDAHPWFQPKGSHDTRRPWRLPSPAAEFSGRVGSRRRNKFRIARFRITAKTCSLHCSSSLNRTRYAGLRFGLKPATGYIPHTAFVLTEFKTKERQVSDDRTPHPTKCLCPRRSGVLRANPKGKISPEPRRKRPHLPTGGLRPLVLHL